MELTSHVPQKCPLTDYERICRLDNLVQILAKAGRGEDWDVRVEPRFRDVSGRLRKPDLVFQRGSRLIVADVTIEWKRPEPLDIAFCNKVATYSDENFLNSVRASHSGMDIYVSALAMGTRGTWCTDNDTLLDLLSLDRGIVASLVNSTIRGGVFIHSTFSRLAWHRR